MEFIAGCMIGGSICAIVVYFLFKGRYEKAIAESYNKGYVVGSEQLKRAILDYIELLNNRSNKDGDA